MKDKPKIAFIQDALVFTGGAEKVLTAALEVYPEAPIYTLVYNREVFRGSPIEDHPVSVSFIDGLPGAHRNHRAYLPLMPLAIERFDLRGYDVVLSFSYAVAHATRTRPDQLHISYIHTPMRYAWRKYPIHQAPMRIGRLPARAVEPFLAIYRLWDTAILKRTDHFITNSQFMAGIIHKTYHRQADVLYPPVDTSSFSPQEHRGNYYIAVSRLVAYKRLDIVVQAFTQLGYPLLIIGEGPEKARLESISGGNIQFLGWQNQERLACLVGEAKAFVHAGEEDFGIALAEAQAAGCPVITYKGGSASEIVSDGRTGLLYEQQNTEDLYAAVERFEIEGVHCGPEQIRANALRFDERCFKQDLEKYVNEKWSGKVSG